MRCMRRGDFAGAWAISDARRVPLTDAEWRKPRHLQRIWNGSDVRGRRVLVRCYHGLGDTIQFVRFLPRLRQLASEVILWAQPALLPLFHDLPGADRLLPLHEGRPEAEYDVDVEVMELPWLLRTTLESLPADVPYLTAPPGPQVNALSRGPRVALAWRAGAWDPSRSMPLAIAAEMATNLGVDFDVLMPSLSPFERIVFAPPHGPNGLVDVAARLVSVDLVITVDTVFAHLAGALARPVWILLAHAADWRWMEERDDSPWYPTARLYRQGSDGDWGGVAARVRRDLEEWIVRPAGAAAPPASMRRDRTSARQDRDVACAD